MGAQAAMLSTLPGGGEFPLFRSLPLAGAMCWDPLPEPTIHRPVNFTYWIHGISGEGAHPAETWIDLLHDLFTVNNYSEVVRFLTQNLFLLPLLLEGRGELESRFGRGVQIRLEVVQEPEAEADRELFVIVRSAGLEPSEALRRLAKFDDEWWYEASRSARCQLTFDVEVS